MGEPITLHKKGGKTITVYGRAAADVLMAAEGWSLTIPNRGAEVTEPDVTVAAPRPDDEPDETTAPKPRKGKAGK